MILISQKKKKNANEILADGPGHPSVLVRTAHPSPLRFYSPSFPTGPRFPYYSTLNLKLWSRNFEMYNCFIAYFKVHH